MLISIVIPVYNVAEYLPKCIESALAGSFQDYEIILVDDGSTDGICPEICDQYGERFPQKIHVIHQENKGLGGARNTGLEYAEGEYILFLDSDDTIPSNALEVLQQAVQATHADIYSFALYSHDGQGHGKVISTSKQYPNTFQLKQHPEFLTALPAAWARLWKRTLFTETGIRFPGKVLYEDIRTSGKLFALAESIVTLPDALYEYLARPGSIMRSGNIPRNREILDAFQDLLEWYEKQGIREQYDNELCKLAIDHIMLAATIRVARLDPDSSLLRTFEQFMDLQFPNWKRNPYIKDLSISHRLLLRLVCSRRYGLIRSLFRIKDGQ